jgi:hypothetical protein
LRKLLKLIILKTLTFALSEKRNIFKVTMSIPGMTDEQVRELQGLPRKRLHTKRDLYTDEWGKGEKGVNGATKKRKADNLSQCETNESSLKELEDFSSTFDFMIEMVDEQNCVVASHKCNVTGFSETLAGSSKFVCDRCSQPHYNCSCPLKKRQRFRKREFPSVRTRPEFPEVPPL